MPVDASANPSRKEGSTRTWTIEFTPVLLQRIVASGFFAMMVLFFFPWTRVLVPASLTPDQPAVVLKNLAVILDCSASMKERIANSSETKMQTVAKAVSDFLDKLPPDTRLACILTGNDRDVAR